MAANSSDCLNLDSDTHPADILEWLAKILEPGHYCQSRDADGKLVLNVDYTGGAIPGGAFPSGTHIKFTSLRVGLERRKDWNLVFSLTSGNFILAVFEADRSWLAFPSTTVNPAKTGLLVGESFAGLLQDNSGTWEARVLSLFNTRSHTFKNLCGPSSQLTPVVAPGSLVKSAGKV